MLEVVLFVCAIWAENRTAAPLKITPPGWTQPATVPAGGEVFWNLDPPHPLRSVRMEQGLRLRMMVSDTCRSF